MVLWVYVALLILGGLMGLIKGKSKVSLIMSLAFALALALCNLGVIKSATAPIILLGLLAVVFLMRLLKTKKFMPSGMMLSVTIIALVLLAMWK